MGGGGGGGMRQREEEAKRVHCVLLCVSVEILPHLKNSSVCWPVVKLHICGEEMGDGCCLRFTRAQTFTGASRMCSSALTEDLFLDAV